MSGHQDRENRVEELIREGDTKEAVQALYQLILDCAGQGEFDRAESLRERLYEVDPMAIREIAQSGEIIEQKKSESLDPEHRELWSELYSRLSQEEANTLYYSLKTVRFNSDAHILREGETDRSLYFVEKGQLRLTFPKGERVMHLATLGPGEILGEDTAFARTSERTYSATALTPVDACVLQPEALDQWDVEAKNLRAEIYDFCFQKTRIPQLLEEHKLDRRDSPRVRVQGTMAARVLNETGKPVSRPFKGEIRDLSSGGLAFSNSFKREETALSLLGRRIAVMCKLRAGGQRMDVKKLARVVGTRAHPFSEYSFHLRFDRPVSREFVDSLDPAGFPGTSPDLEVEV